LVAQHEGLVARIAALRDQAAKPSRFLDNANALLSRNWSRANWQSRQEILTAARWLVDLAEVGARERPGEQP
jgi:hypothetical protein